MNGIIASNRRNGKGGKFSKSVGEICEQSEYFLTEFSVILASSPCPDWLETGKIEKILAK